ncbi:MAG: hypothetical protein IT348_09970 [Candidatus Eisenbacteria bacterium]|nr:hypothetical protein [Candidatus Eisenbacteria bacterium]
MNAKEPSRKQANFKLQPGVIALLERMAKEDCRSMVGQFTFLVLAEAKRRKLSAPRPARRRATSAA